MYAQGAISIAGRIFDIFVAFVVSVYFLNSRSDILRFFRRLTGAIFNKKIRMLKIKSVNVLIFSTLKKEYMRWKSLTKLPEEIATCHRISIIHAFPFLIQFIFIKYSWQSIKRTVYFN